MCRYDCEDIWSQFEEAVVRQSSCNVTVEDYHPMFYAMPQTWPCDSVSASPPNSIYVHDLSLLPLKMENP